MATPSTDTKFYFNFNFPLQVVQLILGLIFGNPDPNTPAVTDPATREWFSNPRPGADPGIETISTLFKLPLSVSRLSLDILRVPCSVEVWYQDRSNNWRPVLDESRQPVRVTVSFAAIKSYYTYAIDVYPIVAKQLQFRITRYVDPTLSTDPYIVGLRNCLIRRNVYDRSQGQQYFEDEQDVLGNVISKYIKDWDATKAADDDPTTFWKSAPMPDPAAVTSLFLDVRNSDSGPNTIDRLYLDPVYTGSMLNLYYSSDDTIATRKLSPITINPDQDENTSWTLGTGRSDTSSGTQESYYRWGFDVGPLVSQPAWVGVEWAPDFDPTSGPPENPVLYRNISAKQVVDWQTGETDTTRLAQLSDLALLVPPDDPGTSDGNGTFRPIIYYDVGAGEITLEFYDGTYTRTYSTALSPLFAQYETLRVVAGWRYAPDTVYLSVVRADGSEIAHLETNPTTLPAKVSFDGESEIYDYRGLMTALVVKLEDYAFSSVAFQRSAVYYVDPDPVLPNPDGSIPSTTLDNAVYAVDWTSQEHGSGGTHESVFEAKEWTPIWKDYVTEKGMLFFPQAIAMKYLKLEFTNLTEQPYPIYESGVETRYRVYPTSVIQSSTLGPQLYTGSGGFLGLGTFISANGTRSVNFLNPASVIQAIGSVLAPQVQPVQINQQAGLTTDTLPNQPPGPFAATDDWRFEAGSSYVYKRDALQPYIVASDAINTTVKAEGLQQLAQYTDVPWSDIAAANPGAITTVKSTGTLPIRGTDWWIYPGQQLKVPASVMTSLTNTDTVTERKLTLEHRVRFNTTQVHRYDYKTITRDAAIAYFAAIRECQPYTTTFIDGEDKPYFDFPSYAADQWNPVNIRYTDSGPITVDARDFEINNPGFDGSLIDWGGDSTAAAWTWDATTGRWNFGAAHLTLDGTSHVLQSSQFDVAPGDNVTLSVWTKWTGLSTLGASAHAQYAQIAYYDSVGNRLGSDDNIFAYATFADWSTHLASSTHSVETDSPDDPVTDDWVQLTASGVVPSGVAEARIFLASNTTSPTGDIWFDQPVVTYTEETDREGTVGKTIQTTSTFAKVSVDFTDSGLWRSDSMWADIDEDTQSILDTQLAPYVTIIPENIEGGLWGDTVKTWDSTDTFWGAAFPVVSVNIDSNRIYDSKRVLHIQRLAGAGEGGIKVTQQTNYVPAGLFRIGATFLKPLADSNSITVRLRRLSDGVQVYTETISPPVGVWYTYVSRFIEIPDSPEQQYEVILTLTGDEADDLYLNDLYTEIANIRYFVRMGSGGVLQEVTDLRYVNGRANVTVTDPVNEFTVQAAILADNAYAYGCRITPIYLK